MPSPASVPGPWPCPCRPRPRLSCGPSTAPPGARRDAIRRVGDIVGDWTLVALLGTGATSATWLARHRSGAERILILLAGAPPTHRAWLAEHGDRLCRLRHQHIAEIDEILDVDGAPALVVRRAAGEPLHRLLLRERPPLHAALRLFGDVVEAVAAAHAQGVLHLALSTHQVIVEEDALGSRSATVVSFGMASPAAPRSGHVDPGFLAPEQLRDPAEVDERTDVFALAAMLAELACGRRPFSGGTPQEVKAAILAGETGTLPTELPPPVRRVAG
ncbi:MAG: hypothetical protein D6798_02670, partial [Deltaproteobacteria bacterium]